MANLTRIFTSGRMNKVVDERLIPDGEYIDAMNVRMGSTENAEIGVIENTKGNLPLTTLTYIDGTLLSTDARCIGAIEDSARETIYWFVHDPNFPTTAIGPNPTNKLDMIVSYNMNTNILLYHVVSINDGNNVNTTLNFNPAYLITGIDIIEDLLFFTDDYNAPRKINIKTNYPVPVLDIDQFTDEAILVIKKPPVEAPQVQLITTAGQENYLEDRFISFAYRYKYEDGEYSATSQWSDIAFSPNPFSFSIDSMLNEGMTNIFNTAIVSYNSGGPLVVGIDLLFKQANNNIIKVIEKIDKAEAGLADNTVYQFQFNNSKIFTVLSEAELLRLYDNVPRFAKAQTIMGNRLMYGNYVEGYDLIDSNGDNVKLEYVPEVISEEIGVISVDDTLGTGTYLIDGTKNISNSIVFVDLTDVNLVEGAFLNVTIRFAHSDFTGDLTVPTEETGNTEITFNFYLDESYSSVYDMASSTKFQEAVGTIANILPVNASPPALTSCDGITLTDQFNCVIPNNLDLLEKKTSGITADGQPIKVITSPSSNLIGFQLCAMRYEDNPVTGHIYEYYQVTFADATFQEIASPRSLHSNRGYEIGIVYMDDYNRATTALVSPNNAVHIPCGLSQYKNSIRVTIPPTQRPPAWATRYKFVIKPDEENYDIIYSNLFFTDPLTNSVWFYLEGENTKKVEVGDRLIVKADTDGPKENCAYATVLEKEAKEESFITPVEDVGVPAGIYMKINPNSFSAVLEPDAIVDFQRKQNCNNIRGGAPNPANLNYVVNLKRTAGFDPLHPLWEYEDVNIPAGSIITMILEWLRRGVGGACERRGCILDKRLTSSADYDNFQDWWDGDNVAELLNNVVQYDTGTTVQYIPGNGILSLRDFSIMYVRFYRDPINNMLVLQMSRGFSCSGSNYPNSRKFCARADIQIFRATSTIVFETEPQDALPDVFFENNMSFPIVNGNHYGNVQDQDILTSTSAIVDTEFFNCFSFGNGVESYKIRDSIIGRSFNLGERVTAVAEQDYREIDRFADITYSGNYNQETNVNRLNVFNKGLSNYKNCELSFGEIMLLDGRETDVLVLQEDKISYVLAGKNLLSDASAGNVITATPEVLGTQIARVEKYGISFNPESYVQWGYDRYFTDAKRGAVLQLTGDSAQSDRLTVVSEMNMRTWFRDTFNSSFNTQKLGGFDPYMNEYVLTSNDELLPFEEECINCGMSQTFNLSNNNEEAEQFTFCVNVGSIIGESTVSWIITSIDEEDQFKIDVDYNGDVTSSGIVNEDGSFTFDKDDLTINTATVTVSYIGNITFALSIGCPVGEELNIVEVVLTNNFEAGETIHTQYRYTNGLYVGPLISDLVVFQSGTGNPLVSRYNITTGNIGTGAFPPESSTMRMYTSKIPPDTYNFDILQDKFRYLRSSTLYNNNDVDMQALIAASSTATPISNVGDVFYADFTVPLNTSGNYLYLIWDLRDAYAAELCYSDVSEFDVCCNCSEPT